MSTGTAAVAAAAPANVPVAAPAHEQIDSTKEPHLPNFLHSPPDSNDTHKTDASDSELSDLDDEEPILSDAPMPIPASDDVQQEEQEPEQEQEAPQDEDDIGEVLPDHWTNGVPVFKPAMHQFKDFKRFMTAVDCYGMKSGIIKIIPPKEWKDALPELDQLVKQVKVREPIKQDIMGSNGTYRQVNILHGRSYNLPQWRQLCEQSEHQPPARRGERRANAEKPRVTRPRAAAQKPTTPADPSTPKKRGRGRPPKTRSRGKAKASEEAEEEDRPMTPVSPKPDADETKDKPVRSIEEDASVNVEDDDAPPPVSRMGGSRQAKPKTQSISARRKYSRREGSAMIDEAAFKDWDYRMDISDYTPERCEELERVYWKTLTYAPPLYGADLMGTLFDESLEKWNLNKLPNLLDVLGTKVPGVNTAYLYLGMWKATFAWHLEDVDLYSINYLHFGAPKQWYSISQADARRFEGAMKSIWPADAKACDQFLRHKAFLISPQHLLSHYGIKVNKCVSYPGEFVVTYPFGYHSGYNLGYNCAEAVNFALDSWLALGKVAKKCECAQAQDSVWVDVYEIERKLRGESTEYEETEDEDDEGEDEEDGDEASGLPTPPSGQGVKFKTAGRKRKRASGDGEGKAKVKKIRLRLKTKAEPPCCLCPNDIPAFELLPTNDGRKAHRMCALHIPETYIDTVEGQEVVLNAARIPKDRLDLKCLYCRSKRGACFQCSQKKCARSYHPTCAAAAGVFVEEQDVPVFGEDGTEYKEQAFEFSCRFHRTKRDKKLDSDALDNDPRAHSRATALKPGEICQVQYYKGDIFAGLVIENRKHEQTLLLDILPNGDRLEVEWKWLLVPGPADYHLPKASANAVPMPTSRQAKDKLNAKRQDDDKPRKDDTFVDGFTWGEFHMHEPHNPEQAKVDFSKPDQLWFYLGKTSTEGRAQYTEDPTKPRHNPRGNFLDTVPKPPRPAPIARIHVQKPYGNVGVYDRQQGATTPTSTGRPEKPYVYKPRQPVEANIGAVGNFTTQRFMPTAAPATRSPASLHPNDARGCQNQLTFAIQRFEVKSMQGYVHQPNMQVPPYPVNVVPGAMQGQWAAPANTQHLGHIPQHQFLAISHQNSMMIQQRPQGKPSWQVHSSIYQKFAFFQVHHNRDSTKYRTPYSALGGFTNGYEGNLRAHLMANKHDLLRASNLMLASSSNHMGRGPGSLNAYSGPYNQLGTGFPQLQAPPVRPPPPQAPPHVPSPAMSKKPPPTQQGSAMAWSPSTVMSSHPHLPPAIKQQYLPGAQQSRPAVAVPPQAKPKAAPGTKFVPTVKKTVTGKAAAAPKGAQGTKATPGSKAYKIPPKESPVPLPANFLAAMTSSTTTSTSTPRVSARTSGNNTSATATPNPAARRESVKTPSLAKYGPVGKVSTTPVPIPNLPGMIQPMSSTMQGSPNFRVVASTEAPKSAVPSLLQSRTEGVAPIGLLLGSASFQPQGFPDVPGSESMEFVERLMRNLRKVSQRENPD